MDQRQTELLHPAAHGLDERPADEILAVLLEGQMQAAAAVRPALPAIAGAARLMAACLLGGGRVCYAGAGSSALMANADAMELPGTFGIDPDRILLCMAGGLPGDARMPGDTEDDVQTGRMAGATLGPRDLVIAVSASGSTPYLVALTEAAGGRGARVVAVTNTPAAPILARADAAILLATPPEPVAGSTRMGAGTAQKIALNLMSTLAALHLGQIHDGMMVGLRADNAKLRMRAAGIVARISGAGPDAAAHALDAAGGDVKTAVLRLAGADGDQARALLNETNGILRAALARLNAPAASAG